MNDPLDVLQRMEPHVGSHGRDEGMTVVPEISYCNLLPLEVSDGAHPICPEELVTARMQSAEHDKRLPSLEVEDERWGGIGTNVRLSGAQHLAWSEGSFERHVLHVGEPFGLQELLSDVHGCQSDRRLLDEDDSGRLGRGLGPRLRRLAHTKPGDSPDPEPVQELSAADSLSCHRLIPSAPS